jgi:hypothetical protein
MDYAFNKGGRMAFHVVGLSDEQFSATAGSFYDFILKVLNTASRRTMQQAALDRGNYKAKTILEVRTLAAYEDDGLPSGFEDYTELFFFNNPALAECNAAGMKYPVIKQITEEDMPPNAGIVCRVPLYLHNDFVANSKV